MKRKTDFYPAASEFVANYKKMPKGSGFTDPKTGYTLQRIKLPFPTPTRVSRNSKTIDCNIGRFEKYSRQAKVFFILHCYYVDFNDEIPTEVYKNADTKAFQCLIKHEGKMYPKTFKEFASVLTVNSHNIERVRNITKLIQKQNVRKKRTSSRSKK